MRHTLLFAIILVNLFFITGVYAEVSVSQPKAAYSLGDELALSVLVKSVQSGEGFIRMALVCGNESKEFYLSPFSLPANGEKTVDAKLTFGKSFFLGAGRCYVNIDTPVGAGMSQSFEVTDLVDLSLSLAKLGFASGEAVSLKGSVKKPNGQQFVGFYETVLDGTDIRIVGPFSGESFNVNFTLPEGLKSGTYVLRTTVYEKDLNGQVTNHGIDETQISVAKMPQKIEVAIASQSVNPGQELLFKVFMYDQANEEVMGDVTIHIRDPEGEEAMTRLVRTGEDVRFVVPGNATPGYWKIEGAYNELTVRRLFYVENQEVADFAIVGDVLIIKNIGNSPYKKAVQIAIGDEVEIKELELEVGEERRYRLAAPDGVYKVSVTDGTQSITLDTVSLTGNAIGVTSEKGSNVFLKYPLFWIFIVIVFGMFVLMMFERFADRRFIGYNVPERTPIEIKKGWTTEGLTVAGVKPVEHSTTLHGHKEEATLIAFKIKNMHELSEESLINIETLFKKAYDERGVVYKTGDYLVVILTPSITKTFKNNLAAVKLATELSNKLQETNRKLAKRVDYGVGVHYGNIIVEPLKDRFKFTSIGNSLSLAKRIAELSKGEVLISGQVNSHMESGTKTEKMNREGIDVYALKKYEDRSKYDGFIQGFLHRNEAGKK